MINNFWSFIAISSTDLTVKKLSNLIIKIGENFLEGGAESKWGKGISKASEDWIGLDWMGWALFLLSFFVVFVLSCILLNCVVLCELFGCCGYTIMCMQSVLVVVINVGCVLLYPLSVVLSCVMLCCVVGVL